MAELPEPEHKTWRIKDGICITGLDWCSDKPLAILSHANGFCAATWSPVAQRLLSRYHVVALDARGHGKSSTPPPPDAYNWQFLVDDLLQVARQILATKNAPHIALAAGSSLGGVISAAAAAQRPDLFRRVVMLDPPLLPNEEVRTRLGIDWPPEAQSGGRSLADQVRQRRSVWPDRAAARNAWRRKPMFAEWTNQAFELYLEHGLRDRPDGDLELCCPPEVEATIFEQTAGLDIFQLAKNVLCPVQVVHASLGVFPISLFREMASVFPQGSLISLEGGHLLPMESPELTAELLLGPDG